MKKQRAVVIFITVCQYLFFWSITSAQTLYVGAGLGYGQTGLNRPSQIDYFQRNGATWSGWLSSDFNPYLAAEAGYVRMDNVKAAGVVNGIGVKDIVEPSMSYVAVRGSIPIKKHLTAVIKVGGAYVYGKEKLEVAGIKTVRSQHKIRPYGALGAEVPINKQIAMHGVYATTTKKDLIPRLSTFLFGINYKIA